MTAKRVGFMIIAIALILAINADAVASGKWTDLEQLFAQAKGGDPMGLYTSMDNVIIVNEEGILSKNAVYQLNSFGANELQFTSRSYLESVDGDHISTIQNGISQTYNLPIQGSISMSQNNVVTGFPANPVSDMSSQMSILDNTGTPLMTFSSNMDDNAVESSLIGLSAEDSSDVDALINSALAEMGFTMTIDDFESLTLGSVQYSIDRTDSNNGVIASWGETRNLPVIMDK